MRLVVYLLPLLLWVTADAQKIEIKEAQRQDWSGGVAGKRGSNFQFELAFHNVKGSIILDTLWIEGIAIVMVAKEKDGSYGGNFTEHKYFTKKGRTEMSFNIRAGFSDINVEKTLPPIEYEGVALLSYRYNDKRCYYVIPKLTLLHDPINYP